MRFAAQRDAVEIESLPKLLRHPYVTGIEKHSETGVPDTEVHVRDAGSLWMEWKAPSKKLKPAQVTWWQKHEAAGGRGVVVDSLLKAIAAVNAFHDGKSLERWHWSKFAPKGTAVPNKERR